MHALYNFHFLNTVSVQLKGVLDDLTVTGLNTETLATLNQFQEDKHSKHGVYLIHYAGEPVYLGKANDLADRLGHHLRKLGGRENIELEKVGYKAIVLDASMSTAANEDVLISMFKKTHRGMWNGKGFGPKDPGKERDTTKPNWFDKQYPIKRNIPITFDVRNNTIASLVQRAKDQLPYWFRYNISEERQQDQIELTDLTIAVNDLLQLLVDHLGEGWKGVILHPGLILYKTNKEYPYGTVLLPR